MTSDNSAYQQKCDLLTKETEIRFAGFLDFMGNLVVGKFREGVTPFKNEDERKKMFIEAVLRIRKRQKLGVNNL
jgi:hypothetical protein